MKSDSLEAVNVLRNYFCFAFKTLNAEQKSRTCSPRDSDIGLAQRMVLK